MVRAVAALVCALLLHGCGGCADVSCSHPLSLFVSFPDAEPDQPVSLSVEYDDERRFISCPSTRECEVTCGNEPCPERDYDVVVGRHSGGFELSLGHMSERPSDGESSCRGADVVRLEVSRGRASFEVVELEVEYERNVEYGGPGCGYADAGEQRDVALAYR